MNMVVTATAAKRNWYVSNAEELLMLLEGERSVANLPWLFERGKWLFGLSFFVGIVLTVMAFLQFTLQFICPLPLTKMVDAHREMAQPPVNDQP